MQPVISVDHDNIALLVLLSRCYSDFLKKLWLPFSNACAD